MVHVETYSTGIPILEPKPPSQDNLIYKTTLCKQIET